MVAAEMRDRTSIPSKLKPVCLTILLLVLAPTPATAEPLAPAPQSLHGQYNATTGAVELQWSAPDAGEYTYRIYRSGMLLGESNITQYVDPWSHAKPYEEVREYHVTAVNEDGDESIPSNSYLVLGPPICTIMSITVDSSDFPPVSARYHESCVRQVREIINEFLPIKQNLIP